MTIYLVSRQSEEYYQIHKIFEHHADAARYADYLEHDPYGFGEVVIEEHFLVSSRI